MHILIRFCLPANNLHCLLLIVVFLRSCWCLLLRAIEFWSILFFWLILGCGLAVSGSLSQRMFGGLHPCIPVFLWVGRPIRYPGGKALIQKDIFDRHQVYQAWQVLWSIFGSVLARFAPHWRCCLSSMWWAWYTHNCALMTYLMSLSSRNWRRSAQSFVLGPWLHSRFYGTSSRDCQTWTCTLPQDQANHPSADTFILFANVFIRNFYCCRFYCWMESITSCRERFL